MEQNIPLFISKSELANMYMPTLSPHSAVNKLMSWIELNTELTAALIATGYKKTQKQFNRAQIRLIFDYLDEP